MSLRRYNNPPNQSNVAGKKNNLVVQPGGLTDEELAALLAEARSGVGDGGGAGDGGGEEENPCAVTVTANLSDDGILVITLTDSEGNPVDDATVTVGPA